MAANMWRVPSSVVRKGGAKSLIQDRGVLRHASVASKGKYLFTEVGAGTQPLALIGMWHEVLNFLAKRPACGIHNQIKDLPDIYMGICYYRPGQRFVGLFPIHDSILELTKGITQFVGQGVGDAFGSGVSHLVGEGGGGISEGINQGKGLSGKKKKSKGRSLGSNEVYVKFSYLPEEGMDKIGARSLSFESLYPVVRDSLSAMAGV